MLTVSAGKTSHGRTGTRIVSRTGATGSLCWRRKAGTTLGICSMPMDSSCSSIRVCIWRRTVACVYFEKWFRTTNASGIRPPYTCLDLADHFLGLDVRWMCMRRLHFPKMIDVVLFIVSRNPRPPPIPNQSRNSLAPSTGKQPRPQFPLAAPVVPLESSQAVSTCAIPRCLPAAG